MKKIILITSIIIATTLIFFACSEEREHASPFDPEYWDSDIPGLTDFNLVNTAIDTIKLTWSNTAELPERYSYRIDKKIGSSDWIENYKIVASNQTTCKDYAEINETISYRACIIYDKNISDKLEDNIVNIFPPPTNLTVTQTSITSANLSWTDNSIGEEKFEIERKLSTESTYTKVGEVTGSSTTTKSWADTATIPNQTYDYKVTAVKGTDKSVPATKQLANPFQAPTGLTATQNNVYTFTLNWTDNSTGEDGFKIERKIDDGAYAVIATVTETSYVDNTVSKGFGTVYYQVRGYKGTDGYSTYTTTNSAVSFPAPTNLTATQTSITSANLSWTDNSIGEEKFEIERKLSTESTYIKVAEVTGSDATTKSWADLNLTLNFTYDYRVIAVKGLNSSAYITITGYLNEFRAPENFIATPVSITSVTLSWNDIYIGEDKFEIERKLSSELTYLKIGEVTGSETTTKTYTDSSIAPNVTYNYKVRIVDGTVYSAYASVTHANTFQAPTGLTASLASETSIKLYWTDNSNGEDGFRIERRVGVNGSWVADYASVGIDIQNYTDTGLTPGITYYYRIRAYYETFYSLPSNEELNQIPEPTKFISIPTGNFNMGQTDVATPVHTVYITRPYYLSKYEIKQKEWQTLMGSNPSIYYGVGDIYPVYNVSWYSILVYCNKRSMNEGLFPCYIINGSTDPSEWGSVPTSSNSTWDAVICDFSAKGYRLPTEAEWEYAARYNDGRTYPWGETAPTSTLCNYSNTDNKSTPVGSYPSGNSSLGLCDMSGNVWEWVWDWYATYTSSTQTDPIGPSTNNIHRVSRGGAWFSSSDNINCAFRYNSAHPYTVGDHFGFRIARTK